jgi:hypothetical protein
MSKVFTLIVFIVFGITTSFSQTWNWARSIGNKDAETNPLKIFPLSNGENLIVANYLEGSKSNVFLATVNPAGTYTWTQLIEGSINNVLVSLDSKENIYLTGYTFDLQIKYDSLIFPLDAGYQTFVLKINNQKQIEWIKKPENSFDCVYYDMIIDNEDHLILSGGFIDRNFNDNKRLLIEKYNENLELITSKRYLTDFYQNAVFGKVLFDYNKNIVAFCTLFGDLTINDTLKFSNNGNYIPLEILIKFDNDFNVIHAQQLTEVRGIYNIISFENEYFNAGKLDNNNEGIYITKLDNEFRIINQKKYFWMRPDSSYCTFNVSDLDVDEMGNLYVSTTSNCEKYTFGNVSYTSKPYRTSYYNDASVFKFDSSLNAVTMWPIGNELEEFITDIDVINEDHFLITGTYTSASIKIGDFILLNPSPLIDRSTHAYENFSRNSFLFYASFGIANPTTNINPPKTFTTTLFPNPTSDFLNIQWKDNALVNGSFDIYSLDGKLVSKQYFPIGLKEVQLDVRYYPKGAYIVRFSISNGDFVQKFVKN